MEEFEFNQSQNNQSIENQINGKEKGAGTQNFESAPNGATNFRETFMRWAGWIFIIMSIVIIVENVFNLIGYLDPSFTLEKYIKENKLSELYNTAELIENLDFEKIKTTLIVTSSVSIAVALLYVGFGIIFLRDAGIYYDADFPSKKYLWISIIGLFEISLIAGMLGIVAANKKNETIVISRTDFSSANQQGETQKSDADVMAEKIVKLKKLKEDDVISEEEYADLISKVTKED